jgi:D-3-phosphoglycerate dehydrogenase
MSVKAVKREGGKEGGREEGPDRDQAGAGWLTRIIRAFRPVPKEEGGREGGVEIVSLASLHAELPKTTALLLALPGTAATIGMIGEKEIDLLPPSAVVVNVGRGGVVEEEALFRALKERRIWAAGLDVWWQVRGRERGREGGRGG